VLFRSANVNLTCTAGACTCESELVWKSFSAGCACPVELTADRDGGKSCSPKCPCQINVGLTCTGGTCTCEQGYAWYGGLIDNCTCAEQITVFRVLGVPCRSDCPCAHSGYICNNNECACIVPTQALRTIKAKCAYDCPCNEDKGLQCYGDIWECFCPTSKKWDSVQQTCVCSLANVSMRTEHMPCHPDCPCDTGFSCEEINDYLSVCQPLPTTTD